MSINGLNNGVQNIEGMDKSMEKSVLNNGVQTNNEGMIKMVNVNVSAIVKGTGLTKEEVLNVANQLGLEVSATGNKINNVVSTAEVVEAVKELIAKTEAAVSINNDEQVEGMDVKMTNVKKVKEIIRRLKAETKVYRTRFMTVEDYNDYQEAVKSYKDDKVLQDKLAVVNNKRDLVLKIVKQLEEGIFTYKMYDAVIRNRFFLTEAEFNTAELAFEVAIAKSSMKNYKNILAVKRWTKDIPVVLLRRVISSGNSFFTTEVAPQMESSLVRACNITEKVIADNRMTLEGKTTDELLLFSFDRESLQFNSSNERENIAKKDDLASVFEMIAGVAKQKAYIVERVSGLADFYTDLSKIKLMPGEVIKQYEFLGITPSGLRSGTMTLAITKEIHGDGTEVNRDRRIEILDKSSDNAFSMNFIEGYNEDGSPIFKGCDTLLDAFKDMSRMMLSATASKVLGTLDSYLVVSNISHDAGYNENDYNIVANKGDKGFVDCSDTTDGLGLIASAFAIDRLHQNNIPCSARDLLGMTFQSRGGGTKIASMLRSKAAMRLEAKAALARGAKVLKAVFNGEEISAEELLANDELLNEFLNNLDGLFDKNGMKLIDHNESIEIVMLKKAYSSDSRLSDVLNIIMMVTDEKATTALLSKRIKASILDKIKEIGISMDYNEETGEVTNIHCDFEKLSKLNNDPQTTNWIVKSFMKQMIAVAPGVLKTDFNSLLKGVANLINELNVEVDCEYTVIQSDAAVRFGVRILREDEVYCPSLNDVKKISGVRHPVSNLFAVSTFKVVDLATIAKRIQALKVSDEIKAMLFEFYQNVEGYAIIPASHYYMEKHDGMDFDIDAMQFFKDEEVVAILENVNDIGTIIDRSIDEAMGCSISKSADDKCLESFYQDVKKKIFRPIGYGENVVMRKEPVAAKKGMARPASKTVAKNAITYYKKNAEGKYPLDFSSVALMVLDYFLNPIDSVGIMATNFYNNAKILMALKSSNEEITTEMKTFICNGMKKMFSCAGNKNYVTPIRRNEEGEVLKKEDYAGRNKFILSKDICHQVIKAFTNSKGDYNDCVQFLLDACICSRYPAETSIDSAKKMYQVINMFALSGCIKAMGAKNAVQFVNYDPFKTDEEGFAIEKEDSVNAFNEIIDIFNGADDKEGYSYDNFFDLKLIKENMKCVGWKCADDAKFAFVTEKKVAGVKDPIYLLKEELMNFANSVTVIAAKELEAYIKSDEAVNIRREFKACYNADDSYFRVDKVVSNIVGSYITITESIKTSDEDEIDDITAKKYLKSYALEALKNTASLSFKTARTPLTDEQIGAGVFYYMITSFEKNTEVCTTVHSEIFSIFQKEILAFMKSKDMEVLAAEEILYAVNPNTNRTVKLDELVGLNCSAYKGHGSVETLNDEECLITLKSKKATFEDGVIAEKDGKYVVIQERKALEENLGTGFYFAAKLEEGIFNTAKLLMDDAKKTATHAVELEMMLGKINPTQMLAEKNYEEIKFKTIKKRDDNNKPYKANVIVGIKDDRETVIAELYLNTVVAQMLNETELSLDNIRLFMTDKSCTVNIVDPNLLAEVEMAVDNSTVEDSFASDVDMFSGSPEFDSEVVMPVEESMIQEAALTDHEEEYSDVAPVMDGNDFDSFYSEVNITDDILGGLI